MPRIAKSQTTPPSGPRLIRKTVRRPPPEAPASLTEQITKRAYELFLQEGAVHGRDVEHWLTAEQELLKPQAPVRPVVGARAKD